MQVFEYPYVIITILVLCFAALSAVGVYFAVKGAKTAKGSEGKAFVSISRLEAAFQKSGKLREDRCVFYARVSLDQFRSLYSAHSAAVVFSETRFRTVRTAGSRCAEIGTSSLFPVGTSKPHAKKSRNASQTSADVF